MNLLISMLLSQPGANGEVVTKAAEAAAKTAEAATEAATEAARSGGMGMWGMVLYIVFFIAIFYLLIIRPQKKKDKQLKEMQSAIQVGEDIMTSSGFYGKVVEVNDDVATVEFGTNKGVRIPVKKSELFSLKPADSKDAKTESK